MSKTPKTKTGSTVTQDWLNRGKVKFSLCFSYACWWGGLLAWRPCSTWHVNHELPRHFLPTRRRCPGKNVQKIWVFWGCRFPRMELRNQHSPSRPPETTKPQTNPRISDARPRLTRNTFLIRAKTTSNDPPSVPGKTAQQPTQKEEANTTDHSGQGWSGTDGSKVSDANDSYTKKEVMPMLTTRLQEDKADKR